MLIQVCAITETDRYSWYLAKVQNSDSFVLDVFGTLHVCDWFAETGRLAFAADFALSNV